MLIIKTPIPALLGTEEAESGTVDASV